MTIANPNKIALDVEYLRRIIHYDPETGVFTWRERICKKVIPGRIAGCCNACGYWQIGIGGIRYSGHRLAWLYMTGQQPPQQIDHINRDCADNRWGNLRGARVSENKWNCKTHSHSRTGIKGVQLSKNGRRWYAIIKADHQRYWLGSYPTPKEAADAYAKAAIRLHGHFARFGERA